MRTSVVVLNSVRFVSTDSTSCHGMNNGGLNNLNRNKIGRGRILFH